jgi:hypothetical protein
LGSTTVRRSHSKSDSRLVSNSDNALIDFSVMTRKNNLGIRSRCIDPNHVALTFDDGIHL